jgi:hypothetical protein
MTAKRAQGLQPLLSAKIAAIRGPSTVEGPYFCAISVVRALNANHFRRHRPALFPDTGLSPNSSCLQVVFIFAHSSKKHRNYAPETLS